MPFQSSSSGGSVLTNKYAEGYPGRRYYGGCEHVDVVETLALERVKKLFGAEHANVQPHSGAQANMAVYFSCLEPGDTILAMNLAHGGHLTHGMHLNFSGKLYKVVHYGVRRDSETIDFDQVAALAREHRPKLILAGASALTSSKSNAAGSGGAIGSIPPARTPRLESGTAVLGLYSFLSASRYVRQRKYAMRSLPVGIARSLSAGMPLPTRTST